MYEERWRIRYGLAKMELAGFEESTPHKKIQFKNMTDTAMLRCTPTPGRMPPLTPSPKSGKGCAFVTEREVTPHFRGSMRL